MNEQVAYVGGGCFWCTEAIFRMVRGVLEVTPGYAGGVTDRPTYFTVSTGTTGHAEVVRVRFDADTVSYKDLLTVFFATHDPTTLNVQGADTGTQYRSIILATNARQEKEAVDFIEEIRTQFRNPIVTEVQPYASFTEAEEEHREYYRKNPQPAYCQIVIDPKVKKLREKLPELLHSEH